MVNIEAKDFPVDGLEATGDDVKGSRPQRGPKCALIICLAIKTAP